MTERYESWDQKPYESLHLYVETILDHPVRTVWPQALQIGRWMDAHRLETVAGKPGEVGHFERVYPKGIDPKLSLAHHHVYGIAHLIPEKLIALEVLPEKGGSYGNSRARMSFDSLHFTDLGQKTHLSFLMTDVHLGKGDAAYWNRLKLDHEDAHRLVERYFENLKRRLHDGD